MKAILISILLAMNLFITSCSDEKSKTSSNRQSNPSQLLEDKFESNLATADSLIEMFEYGNAKKILQPYEHLEESEKVEKNKVIDRLMYIESMKKIEAQIPKSKFQEFKRLVLQASGGAFSSISIGWQANVNDNTQEGLSLEIPLNGDLSLLARVTHSTSVNGKTYSCQVITNIIMKGNSIKINLGKGFGADPELNYYENPSFNVTKDISKLKRMVENGKIKVMAKTALTYRDRALFGNKVFDLSGCEEIKYNDDKTYTERVAQIKSKGNVHTYKFSLGRPRINQMSAVIALYEMLNELNVELSD